MDHVTAETVGHSEGALESEQFTPTETETKSERFERERERERERLEKERERKNGREGEYAVNFKLSRTVSIFGIV